MVLRMDIFSITNVPLRVIFLSKGELHPHSKALLNIDRFKNDKDSLEFYDLRYPFTPDGQFISGYYLETFEASNTYHNLTLEGGIEDWEIDASTKEIIRNWIYHFKNRI